MYYCVMVNCVSLSFLNLSTLPLFKRITAVHLYLVEGGTMMYDVRNGGRH